VSSCTPQAGGSSATTPGHCEDFDPRILGRDVYALLNSIVVPRPIAWVSTRSASGVDNLAPHSYFTVSSVQPPVVQFTSVGVKDSLRNVRETGEFVINVSTQPLVDAVNRTATTFAPDVDEFLAAGLATEPSEMVAPLRVAASPVAIECCFADERSFGDSTVVFGEVLHIAVDPAVLRDGQVAPDLLAPVARLGGSMWSELGTVFDLERIPVEGYEPPVRAER
jgi:flavin reductase (DIM6/NTAB) family NADH-FMN oxidoreductase RutF